MFYLFGAERGLRDLVLLTLAHAPGSHLTDRASLREAFSLALARMQPDIPLPPGPSVLVTEDPALCARLLPRVADAEGQLAFLPSEQELERLASAEHTARFDRVGCLEAAIARFDRLEPSFAELFRLIIRTVMSCPSRVGVGSGTSPAAIGVIWTWCSVTWAQEDVLELLLHELTHTLGYIRQRVEPLYQSAEAVESFGTRAVSTIRGAGRRLDLVVDSLVVAVELLELRRRHLRDFTPVLHPDSESLLQSSRQTLHSIRASGEARLSVFTDSGLDLLERCQAVVDSYPSGP